jgi:diacylglycerol O-acyltransferase / wax synthase
MKMGGKVLEKGMEMYRDPSLAAVLAKEGGEIARELGHALRCPTIPPPLKAGLGVSKRCAWAEPLPLDEVKAVAARSAARSTTCCWRPCPARCAPICSNAAKRSTARHPRHRAGEPAAAGARQEARQPLRPGLPRPADRRVNPLRRLECVAECMREIKSSRQAIMTFGVLAALGMAPPAVQKLALELFSRKATAVATNVPGPQMPLYLAGSAK